ncbi:MAG: monofunctional biosynthetic peptidoglycan transglycosylase [Thermodesulfobacteriota bacterium]|nr:monofunctional biosynthetic peptidoglycan transglycosylase [Thermodesulfobacteriota bacterium]
MTWGWKFFFKLLFVLLILTMTQVLILRFVNPPFTAIIALNWLRDKVNKNHYEIPHYYWRQLKEISPNLRKAVMAGEDQRFLSHHGFDFIEIDHAVRDILKKRRIRGASTITMQTARTVFLWPGRSWLRKMLEVYYTVLIEIFWSKDRIFEIYLNTVDWGNGIMGAEAASKKYFHVHSDYISIYQGALLAAILPSPHRWSPNNPNQIVRARQKRIMNDMKKMPLL